MEGRRRRGGGGDEEEEEGEVEEIQRGGRGKG